MGMSFLCTGIFLICQLLFFFFLSLLHGETFSFQSGDLAYLWPKGRKGWFWMKKDTVVTMCLCMNIWMVLQKLWNILRGKTRKPKGSLGNINSFCPPLRFCIGQAKGMMSEMTLLVGGIAEMTFPSMLWRGDNMPMNRVSMVCGICCCSCLRVFNRSSV